MFNWYRLIPALLLTIAMITPGAANAQDQTQGALEPPEEIPSSADQRRVTQLMEKQTESIDKLVDNEKRIAEHLRSFRRLASERANLERRIGRERLVIDRLNGLSNVVRQQIIDTDRSRLNLRASRNLMETTQTMLLDQASQMNDPTKRDIRLAQIEENVVAIRDSMIEIISPLDVDQLAEIDFNLALDWYLKSQYALVEPLLDDFIETYPTSVYHDEAILMVGDIYRFQSRYTEAEDVFTTLTTSETTVNDIRVLAYALLQDIFYRQARWDEAIAIYHTVANEFLLFPEGYDGAVYIGADSYYMKALSLSSGSSDGSDRPAPMTTAQIALMDSAAVIFDQVTDASPVYILAQQQIAQTYIESGRLQEAIEPLLNAESARPPLWADDIIFESMWIAMARLGHVYLELAREADQSGSNIDDVLRYRNLAMEQYSKVPQESDVYDEVLLALAWIEIEKNNTENAVRLLEHLLDVRPDSEYAYEAWATLGDGYTRLRDYEQAHEVFSQLSVTQRAIALVQASIQESSELDAVKRELSRISAIVETEGDIEALDQVADQLENIEDRKLRVTDIHNRLFEADPLAMELVNYGRIQTTMASMSGLIAAEKAVLNRVDSDLSTIERQAIASLRNRDAAAKIRSEERGINKLQAMATAFERNVAKDLDILRRQAPPAYDEWLKEVAFGKVNIEFTKYQSYKSALLDQYEMVGNVLREIEDLPEDNAVRMDTETVLGDLQSQAEALEGLLSETRRVLVAELNNVIARYPESNSIEPMLFQLADVQYDQTERDFLESNERFSAAFDRGEDPGESPLADYNTPIRSYDRLIREFPQSEFVDQSLFQLGHLLSEQGELERSNRMFERLINEYPESPLVADAYLRVGDFYFDALFLGLTNLGGEELMRRAINAYDSLLDYPANKNFQSALYKLGWSYYNLAAPEEREHFYDDSVEYFTYLLQDSLRVAQYNHMAEEAGIDPVALDPGYDLTGEAIKYIAINFRDRVETGREEERRNWATAPASMKTYVEGLGVDQPYARPLMMAMAEVYAETGQVEAEVTALDSALTVFPNDPKAPRIMQRIIDGYERIQDMAIVDPEVWEMAAHNNETPEVYLNRARERLFREYGRKWAEALEDTTARREALVLAEQAGWRLANYVASLAEDGTDSQTAGIDRAAQYFNDYMTDFPESANAYTARWNYSQYMWRLERYDEAYAEFITVSRDAEKDKYREQAAINAILAAEKLLEQERQAVPATSPGTNASPAELPTLADPNDSGNNL
ncbi:MAG: tetratricopeptide repeat protein [Candidatus Latescibacteria bacterium]|nr:tetratricopeptide repeat protein [Candidatus Latescibacterota bacterium]